METIPSNSKHEGLQSPDGRQQGKSAGGQAERSLPSSLCKFVPHR